MSGHGYVSVFLLPLTAAIPAPAGTGFSWGFVTAAILIWLSTTAATWVVASKVTTAVLREQNKQLRESVSSLAGDVKKIGETIGKLYGEINSLKTERAQCELRAVKTFASRSELAQLLAEAAAGNARVVQKLDAMEQGVRGSVSKVHGRVDTLSERLVRVEAEKGLSDGA